MREGTSAARTSGSNVVEHEPQALRPVFATNFPTMNILEHRYVGVSWDRDGQPGNKGSVPRSEVRYYWAHGTHS